MTTYGGEIETLLIFRSSLWHVWHSKADRTRTKELTKKCHKKYPSPSMCAALYSLLSHYTPFSRNHLCEATMHNLRSRYFESHYLQKMEFKSFWLPTSKNLPTKLSNFDDLKVKSMRSKKTE